MPVVYECPVCEFQGKSGDETAGKEIACKGCGHKFTLPGGTADNGAPPPATQAGTIAIKCPGCGASGKAPAAAQGKKIKCPKCSQPFTVAGSPFTVPTGGPSARLSDSGPPVVEEKAAIPEDVGLSPMDDKPAGENVEVVDESAIVIDTVCPKCKRKGNVPAKFAGKKVKCPQCATLFVIADPAAKSPAPAGKTPTKAPAKPSAAQTAVPEIFNFADAPAKPSTAAPKKEAEETPASEGEPFGSFDYAAPKKEPVKPVKEPAKPAPKPVKEDDEDEEDDDERGRSKMKRLLSLIAILVIGAVAIGVVMVLKNRDNQQAVGPTDKEEGPDSLPPLKGVPTFAKKGPKPTEAQVDPNLKPPERYSEDDCKAGDVVVRGTKVEHDFVKGPQGNSKKRQLILQLQIRNDSKDTAVEYRSWGAYDAVPGKSGTPRMVDSVGRTHRRILPAELGFKPNGQVDTRMIQPGESIADTLVFEPPTTAVDFLNVELPSVNLSKDGILRFSVPGAFIGR